MGKQKRIPTLYALRRAAGRCVTCYNKLEDTTKARCPRCAKKAVEKNRKHRERKKKESE